MAELRHIMVSKRQIIWGKAWFFFFCFLILFEASKAFSKLASWVNKQFKSTLIINIIINFNKILIILKTMSFTAVTHFQRRNKFGQFVRDLRLLKSAFCCCGALVYSRVWWVVKRDTNIWNEPFFLLFALQCIVFDSVKNIIFICLCKKHVTNQNSRARAFLLNIKYLWCSNNKWTINS